MVYPNYLRVQIKSLFRNLLQLRLIIAVWVAAILTVALLLIQFRLVARGDIV